MSDHHLDSHDRDDRTSSLRRELRILCRGRGVFAPDLDGRLGPLLEEHLRKTHKAHRAHGEQGSRARLVAMLTDSIRTLPTDLALVAEVALGLHEEARHRFLRDRLEWLAALMARDVRTVRRRLDESLSLLAEVIELGPATTPHRLTVPPGPSLPHRTVTHPYCLSHTARRRFRHP